MKKIISTIFFIFAIYFISSSSLAASTITIYANGKLIPIDANPYIQNDRVFVPIRFVSEAFNASNIDWNAQTKTATININNTSIKLTANSSYAKLNGQNYKLDAPVKIISSRIYVPVRFISEALGYSVTWSNNSVYISNKNLNTTKSNYSQEDLYWLSRIVNSEASGEPYSGKLAVANVIINRVNSNEFPNTIKDVVFDRTYGLQFSPVGNGTIYNTPSNDSIKAATEALNGKNNIGNSLYFLNPRKATSFWIVKSRTLYTTIANHDFYL